MRGKRVGMWRRSRRFTDADAVITRAVAVVRHAGRASLAAVTPAGRIEIPRLGTTHFYGEEDHVALPPQHLPAQ